jgi:predicted ATPase
LDQLRNLMPNTRLLTLVGAGGLGKTRLCLQLGAEMLDDFPDGVWLIELAPIADALAVPQTVASVLGVKEEPGRPVDEALHAFAKDRKLLLVLDNCEHLAQASADLIEGILRSGRDVKVVASSRVPLRVGGETTYPVAPLGTPDPDRKLGLAALERCEAVRLFLDRALSVQPAFRLTEENASAVAAICHQLDGIPLALELAAARIRTLAVGQVALRLTDRFRILTGGYRTALPRQQTLRACIDWSYDLLTPHEQAVFQRLSVFAGGWTLEAAEDVCAGGEIEESHVLDLLTHLVEKSLVTMGAEFARYRFLETIREYSQERLDATVEEDSVRRRHLAYYAKLTEGATPELVGSKPGEALARLDAEQKNLLAAHAWIGRDSMDAELALRLAVATFHVWIHRGSLADGYRILVETLNRPHAQGRSMARCRTVAAAGNFALLLGRYRDAQEHAEESLAIAREIGDQGRVAMSLQLLGMAISDQGGRATALEHFEESLALIREVGPPRRLAAALQNLAHWHQDGGDFQAAESVLEQTLALTRELGDRSANTAAAMTNLAGLAIRRRAYERARELLCEAAEIAQEIGSRYAGGLTLNGAMDLAACLGDWNRAARLIGATKALSAQTGNRRDALRDDKVRDALGVAEFTMAETDGKTIPYEAKMAEARAWLERRV